MKKVSPVLLILLFLMSNLFAQAPVGSKSLMHTHTARTFDAGRFEIHSDLNFFSKLAEFLGDASAKPEDFQEKNYWLINSGLALTYGVSDNFDLTIAPGLYQDTHSANEFNLPDDIKVSLKAGSFDFANRHMYGAFIAATKFPVGEDHNYPFTYYSSGAVEFGFSGALSYYMDPYIPDRSFSTHLNVGWWNHNEAGEDLYKGLTASTNSSELIYALGFLYPTDMFDFQLELSGATFLEKPDKFVFSREDYMYVTPSIKYKPFSWFAFNLGVDVRLSADEDKSVGLPTFENLNLPNYTAWKAHLGFEITLLPLTAATQSAAQVDKNQFNKRVEFFQKIIEDREKSENIKEELDKLKEERESAEKELEELKQILEEEGN
ncbi:MAG: hypothetical protein D8M58_19440 [Calditrichaeota bacterium]|nr:MAG: hypothetical protein DWQ03_22120 [Calditrichota bacterium]MBL1207586.1 hypothetical protein [Calditrichota bacterium]NOG47419.1 hypothetical protein [Calditrichota bacterium]